MREEHLLEGQLEPTNQWYAVAKIAGVKLCQAYRRQYGCDFTGRAADQPVGGRQLRPSEQSRGAGADRQNVHGQGEQRRRGRDLGHWPVAARVPACRRFADACVHLLKVYGDDAVDSANPWINVGCGADMTIAELAEQVLWLARGQAALRHRAARRHAAEASSTCPA